MKPHREMVVTEHSMRLFQLPACCIHVNEKIAYGNIWIKSISYNFSCIKLACFTNPINPQSFSMQRDVTLLALPLLREFFKDFKVENPLLFWTYPKISVVSHHISIMLLSKNCECFFHVSTSKKHTYTYVYIHGHVFLFSSKISFPHFYHLVPLYLFTFLQAYKMHIVMFQRNQEADLKHLTSQKINLQNILFQTFN